VTDDEDDDDADDGDDDQRSSVSEDANDLVCDLSRRPGGGPATTPQIHTDAEDWRASVQQTTADVRTILSFLLFLSARRSSRAVFAVEECLAVRHTPVLFRNG